MSIINQDKLYICTSSNTLYVITIAELINYPQTDLREIL